MRNILILVLIILIGVSMGITKFSPEDISGFAERLWRMEQDIKNLKMERRVYFSDAMRGAKWTDWTPSYAAIGGMTYTSVSTGIAKYCIIDGVVFFMLGAIGTTGGTPGMAVNFTLPEDGELSMGGGCRILDTTLLSGFWTPAVIGPTQVIAVYKYDSSNWGLGADKGIYVQGFYKMAE